MTWKSLYSHREHGGDIDVARQRFGRADMIDLSTGISPRSYPAPTLTAKRLQALPTQSDLAACLDAARRHYRVPDGLALCAGPGTQALLQLVPLLASDGNVWIEQPTYNEHAPAWLANGHDVSVAPTLPTDAHHAVVVLPNNPTGRADYVAVEALAAEIGRRQGLLLVDGAFAGGDTDADDVRLLESWRNRMFCICVPSVNFLVWPDCGLALPLAHRSRFPVLWKESAHGLSVLPPSISASWHWVMRHGLRIIRIGSASKRIISLICWRDMS